MYLDGVCNDLCRRFRFEANIFRRESGAFERHHKSAVRPRTARRNSVRLLRYWHLFKRLAAVVDTLSTTEESNFRETTDRFPIESALKSVGQR